MRSARSVTTAQAIVPTPNNAINALNASAKCDAPATRAASSTSEPRFFSADDALFRRALATAPAPADLGFEQLPGPRGVADDLKKLPGISPAIEKQLNDLGIFHYTQIAELSPTAAHNVGEEVGLPGRVDGWIAKAKELTAE